MMPMGGSPPSGLGPSGPGPMMLTPPELAKIPGKNKPSRSPMAKKKPVKKNKSGKKK